MDKATGDPSKPSRPIEFEIVEHLTDHEIEYVASYISRAYRTSIIGLTLLGNYVDDQKYPGVGQTLGKAIIMRGLQCGKLAISKDRRAMRFIFPHGTVNKIFTNSWDAPDNLAMEKFYDIVGKDYFTERTDILKQAAISLYQQIFPDGSVGLGKNIMRCGIYVVDPDYQGSGYGRALHDFTLEQARISGATQVAWGGPSHYALLFERLGGKIIAKAPWDVSIPEGDEWEYLRKQKQYMVWVTYDSGLKV